MTTQAPSQPQVQIQRPQYQIEFPPKLLPWLFQHHPYKVLYGGRGGVKSWSFARALLLYAHGYRGRRERILCAREIQASIKDSVHKLLCDQIELLGLGPFFEISEQSIRSIVTGSEFLFKGLRHNSQEIKSTEGITITWVEEAQAVSKTSWEFLEPTVFRTPEAELWISFNPSDEKDAVYQQFVLHPPPGAVVLKTGWEDNPWFPRALDLIRRHHLAVDQDAYDWIWGGECKAISEAIIFRGKYVIEDFDTPGIDTPGALPRFYHGSDFGFANDPTCLVRSFILYADLNREELEIQKEIEKSRGIKLPPLRKEDLYIDQESFGYGVENEDIPALYDKIQTSRTWPIKGDCARPETISYVRRKGFNIEAAEKWAGCVEDRIFHLKGFRKIHIHTRCKHVQEEARLYRYKVDKVTGEVLPVIVDKWNHGWDAQGYALDGMILRRGATGAWANL